MAGLARRTPGAGSDVSLPLREAQWIVADDAPRSRNLPVRMALAERRPEAVLTLGSLSLLWGTIHTSSPDLGFFGTFFGLGGLLLALAFRLARVEDTRLREYAAARAEFEGDHGQLVSLLIRQGDAPTGADVGVLWFEDAHLYFSGRRTSFGLVPDQARGGGRLRDRVPGIRNPVEIALRRDTALGPMTLSIDPLLPAKQSVDLERASLKSALDAWSRDQSDDPGQLPPAAPGPGVVSDRRLLRDALTTTFLGAAAVGLVGAYATPHYAAVEFLLGVWVFVGIVPSSNLRWRALRDRRRMRSLR